MARSKSLTAKVVPVRLASGRTIKAIRFMNLTPAASAGSPSAGPATSPAVTGGAALGVKPVDPLVDSLSERFSWPVRTSVSGNILFSTDAASLRDPQWAELATELNRTVITEGPGNTNARWLPTEVLAAQQEAIHVAAVEAEVAEVKAAERAAAAAVRRATRIPNVGAEEIAGPLTLQVVDRRLWVRFGYDEVVVAEVKATGCHFDSESRRWWAAAGKLDEMRTVGLGLAEHAEAVMAEKVAARLVREKLLAEQEVVRSAERAVAKAEKEAVRATSTSVRIPYEAFELRETIKASGGVWDPRTKCWLIPAGNAAHILDLVSEVLPAHPARTGLGICQMCYDDRATHVSETHGRLCDSCDLAIWF